MMRNQRLRIWFLGLAIVIVGLTLSAMYFLRPNATTAESECPSDWYNSTSADVRDHCGRQKQIVMEQQEKAEQAAATQTPYTQAWPDFTPQPMAKPTDMVGPQEIPLTNVAGGSPVMRAASSVWFLDYVSDADQMVWSSLYLVAWGGIDGEPTYLDTVVTNKFTEDMGQYNHSWTAPEGTGPLIITTVTGWPKGVVHYKTTSGLTGTLDLVTESWASKP